MLAEIEVSGAADGAQARAIAARIATSPLVKTALFGHDANWGRVLAAAGSAPWNGGFAAVDAAKVTLSYNGTVVLDRGVPLGVEPDVSNGSCRIELDLGLGDGRGQLSDERPLLRLRPHQRGLPDMSRIVLKVGGAVAGEAATLALRARAAARGLRRPRRRAADLRRARARRAPGALRATDGG